MNSSTLTGIVLCFPIICIACSGSDSRSGVGGASASTTGGTATSQGGSSSQSSSATGGSAPSGTGGHATGGDQAGGAQAGGSPATGGNRASGGAVGTGGARQTGGSNSGIGGAEQASGGATTTGGGVTTGGAAAGGAVTTGGTKAGTGGAGTGGTKAGTGGAGTGGTAAAGGSATGGTSSIGGSTTAGGTSAATPSSGCSKTPTLTSGSKTIQSGGQSRQYMISVPSNYDKSHPYRLIFAFHWNGGTMNDIDGGGSSGAVWSYYGLKAQANDSTIFVAPQGISNGWANSGGRDLTLVDDLIKFIEGDLCVDTTQLFSVGFSYGGGMTYELACARATVFRAAAVYSGAQLSGCDGGKQPIAYLGIHGVSDGTCNIAGGRTLRDTFVKNNGCTAQTPPEPAAGSGTHICTKYQGCAAGYPVEWCAFDGGHTPGNVDGGGDDGAKTWTKGEVWKFFTQFASTP